MKRKRSSNKLLIDEKITFSEKKGNGVLTRKVWVNEKGDITKYALAYINLNITQKDNGRVLGYDNTHAYHHKHYMGKIIPIEFTSFSNLEAIFQKEFEELHHEHAKKN